MEIGNRESGIGNRAAVRAQAPDSRFPVAASRLDAAAKEFEAVFISQMLEPLFASVETPAVAGGGKSEAFFNGLLRESYAKAFAERGGFGLAAHVKAALIDIQARESAASQAENRS